MATVRSNNRPIVPVQSNRVVRAQSANKPSEDVVSGRVAGANNLTGQLIAAEGYSSGSPTYVSSLPSDGVIRVSTTTSAEISRPKSSSGRGVVITTSDIAPKSVGDISATGSVTNNPDCGNPSSGGGSGGPSPDPDPDPPPSPTSPTPGDPPPPQEPELGSTPYGCSPTDNAQWYNSSDGQSGCPSGTSYLGFAELPGGGFKVLCEGASRPPGDGCPSDPVDSFHCVGGSCVPTVGGPYATLEECQGNCKPPQLYICNNGNCEPSSDTAAPAGARLFNSLEACQANCQPGEIGFNCVEGVCTQVPNGVYTTLAECKAAGCECQKGTTPGVAYRFRVVRNASFGGPVTEFTGPIYAPFSINPQCCVGSLGSNSEGLYGTWTDVNGVNQGPGFIYGACGGGLVSGEGCSTRCCTSFSIISATVERVDGTLECD